MGVVLKLGAYRGMALDLGLSVVRCRAVSTRTPVQVEQTGSGLDRIYVRYSDPGEYPGEFEQLRGCWRENFAKIRIEGCVKPRMGCPLSSSLYTYFETI